MSPRAAPITSKTLPQEQLLTRAMVDKELEAVGLGRDDQAMAGPTHTKRQRDAAFCSKQPTLPHRLCRLAGLSSFLEPKGYMPAKKWMNADLNIIQLKLEACRPLTHLQRWAVSMH